VESTSQGARGGPPAWRGWALLLGGLVLFVTALELLERLFPRERAAPAEVAEMPATPAEPVRPEITRHDNVVEIQVGFHRTTIRLGEDEGSVDDLVACLEAGIERAVADGRLSPASDDFFARLMRDAEVSQEVNRIAFRCVRPSRGEPTVPPPPAPAGSVDGGARRPDLGP